jgi:hypothetical protein
MSDLQHRIKVFVYRLEADQPQYLLLRKALGINPTWGVLDGAVGFHEQIETAILREVCDDIGLPPERGPIDLAMPKRWIMGEEEVVEWPYGFQAPSPRVELVLDDRWAEYRWAAFGEAYSRFQLELDRAAITRLHTMIGVA